MDAVPQSQIQEFNVEKHKQKQQAMRQISPSATGKEGSGQLLRQEAFLTRGFYGVARVRGMPRFSSLAIRYSHRTVLEWTILSRQF